MAKTIYRADPIKYLEDSEINNSKKRRKRKKSKLPFIIFVLILAMVIFAVALIGMFNRENSEAKPVSAFNVSEGLQLVKLDLFNILSNELTVEQEKLKIDEIVNSIVTSGYNAVTVPVIKDEFAIYDSKNVEYLEISKDGNGIFNDFDILKYLSKKTIENQIEIYFDLSVSESIKLNKINNIKEEITILSANYPVNGIILSSVDSVNNFSEIVNNFDDFSEITSSYDVSFSISISDNIEFLDSISQISPSVKFILVEFKDSENYEENLEKISGILSDSTTLLHDFSDLNINNSSTQIFYAHNNGRFNGGVFVSFEDINSGNGSVLRSFLDGVDNYQARDLSSEGVLEIGYPTKYTGLTSYSDKIFIMGVSDASEPLYMNGEEVTNRASKGAFGILVDLSVGENDFEFTQGDNAQSVTITRSKKTTNSGTYDFVNGGNTSSNNNTSSNTNNTYLSSFGDYSEENLKDAKWVKIDSGLVSGLYNPDYDTSISSTLKANMTSRVVEVRDTIRNGNYVKSYLLSSGDYVLASFMSEIQEPKTKLESISYSETDRGVQYVFNGINTPIIHDKMVDGILTLNIYDITASDVAINSLPQGVKYLGEAKPYGAPNAHSTGESFEFTLDEKIWGYDVQCNDGVTTLLLHKAPTLSDDSTKPLTGITVMLDPGHGGSDPGALGIMGGAFGENENTINLNLAFAIKSRLESLGANVVMTRYEQDVTIKKEERAQLAVDVQPDFFLSIHHNSTGLDIDGNNVSQMEAYYFDKNSIDFANSLMNNIGIATNRKMTDPMWDYFYVTRITNCPAVLFEYGYIINPVDYEKSLDLYEIERTAIGTVNGIVQMCSVN